MDNNSSFSLFFTTFLFTDEYDACIFIGIWCNFVVGVADI
jgi:hypothetical protein